MCQLAVKDSNWIRVNNWQSTRHCKEDKKVVSRLLELLKHFQQFYLSREGTAIKIRIFLICGWPLIEQIVQQHTNQDPSKKSFKFPTDSSGPSVLNESLHKASQLELKELLENFDLLVFWSSSYRVNNVKPTLHPLLAQYKHNIHPIEHEEDACSQLLSSSKLRAAISRGDCVKYCLPDPVIAYIQAHDLYQCYFQAEMFKNRFKSSKSSISSLKCKNNVNNLANWDSFSRSYAKDAHAALPNGHCGHELTMVEKQEEDQRLINELVPTSLMTKSLTFEPSTSSSTEHDEDNNDIWRPNLQPGNNLHSTKSYSKSQNWLNYSSDYDNLTLDEILETSKGWDNYFNGSDEASAQSTSTLHNSPQPENIISDDGSSWKHRNGSAQTESFSAKSIQIKTCEPQKCDLVPEKTESSGICSNWPCKSGQATSVWQQRYKDTNTPPVVLTYRRYRLVADPETTV